MSYHHPEKLKIPLQNPIVLNVPSTLTFENSALRPQSESECFVWFSQYTACFPKHELCSRDQPPKMEA
jgi:hypothetical protein